MTFSPLAEGLVKAWEKLRLKAYQDSKGIWTIGWGTTTGAIPGLTVSSGTTCTPDQANAWLDSYLKKVADAINAGLTVALNQNQFDALVSLFYNVGAPSFEHSQLRKRINAGDPNAGDEILNWCYETVNGVRRKSNGLAARRSSEYILFNTVPHQDSIDVVG